MARNEFSPGFYASLIRIGIGEDCKYTVTEDETAICTKIRRSKMSFPFVFT